jgi:hypothetical protein
MAAAAAWTQRSPNGVGRWLQLAGDLSCFADCAAVFECDIEEILERPANAIVIGRVRSALMGADPERSSAGVASMISSAGPKAKYCARSDFGFTAMRRRVLEGNAWGTSIFEKMFRLTIKVGLIAFHLRPMQSPAHERPKR